MNVPNLALCLEGSNLELKELPWPVPSPDDVLVQVAYSVVNDLDGMILRGEVEEHLGALKQRSPCLTGIEFSGHVLEDAPGLRKGTRVMGMPEVLVGPACHQTVLAVPREFVIEVPDGLDLAGAASTINAALTASEALDTVFALRAEHRILVIGASGGVGSFAVQLASAAFAHPGFRGRRADGRHVRAASAGELHCEASHPA
jgi:NADPH2:quinone reductase